MSDLSHPAAVQERLAEIENDLALKQNELEAAALDWFRSKRTKERRWAEAFIGADGSVEARRAVATLASVDVGLEDEARWEGLKAVVRVLGDRANIGMSLLRSQGRS